MGLQPLRSPPGSPPISVKKTNVIQSAATEYVAPAAQQQVQPQVEGPAFEPRSPAQ
jgi:hypothetical protein